MNGHNKVDRNGLYCNARRLLVERPTIEKLARLMCVVLIGCTALASNPGRANGVDSATSCAAVREIPQTECEALKSIYYSLNGSGWSYQAGWLQSSAPCSWIGVICHGGHVTGLSLAFNNLNGILPAAVGDLPHLTSLNLIHNQIRGLPSELARLTELQSLFLTNNNLASLPPEIGALSHLRELHLSGNPLTTLPPEIGQLHELRELYLLTDSLWELPEALAGLENLRVLRVSSPLLSEVLPDMSLWTQLEVLELSGCRLHVWPAALEVLTALHTLDLSHNKLVVLPASVGQLTSLRMLDLSDNSLAELPVEIVHLRLLTELDLAQNELSTLPTEMGELTSLSSLNVSANRLAELPATLGNLISMQNELNVDYNRLAALPARVLAGNLARTDWQNTQTVPPTELQVEVLAEDRVQLTWSPIAYADHGGYYEIMHRVESGAASPAESGSMEDEAVEYAVVGQTLSKESDTHILEGLDPTQVHGWTLRTYTPAHDTQKNYLWSEPGAHVHLYFTHLTLNHSDGLPGTVFAATADGFPADTGVDIYANDLLLETLSTDAEGVLRFLLDTAEADVGEYAIEVVVGVEDVSARATAYLTLSTEGLRYDPPAGNDPTVLVPGGLVKAHRTMRQIYLPTIVR